jgi:hypothetical protein
LPFNRLIAENYQVKTTQNRIKTLVLVAGHAIPHRFDQLDRDDGWYLKPFQSGEGHLYLDHVERGVVISAQRTEGLLIFAGGQTDAAAGPRSEGQGYWLAAEHHAWFRHGEVRERATTEEFSLDSFQNLLYGICRFREVSGAYPSNIIAVGWKFKAARFDLHRRALRFPEGRFHYEGVNDPATLEANLPFEKARTALFERDPYGVTPEPELKRDARNVFRRQHGYRESCPELGALLAHRSTELFSGPLPWS